MENNRKCEENINKYLELDKNEKVPLKLTLHMLFCKKCHSQVRMLVNAEKISSMPIKLQTPITDSSIISVMKKVSPNDYKKLLEEPISLKNWIVSGIIMVLLLFVPAFLTNVVNDRDLSIAYAILIAGCVTIYCSAFIIGNIDFFIKKISAGIQLN